MPAIVAPELDRFEVAPRERARVPGYNWLVTRSLSEKPLDSHLTDALVVTLDLVAVVAVLAFAFLCLTLSRGLQGSALRRVFAFAGLEGWFTLPGTYYRLREISGSWPRRFRLLFSQESKQCFL